MKTKQSQFALYGLIIGIVVGIIASLGVLGQFKKSQRGQLMLVAVGLSSIVFGVSGYFKGTSLGRELDIENELGISKAENWIVKKDKSRSWIGITKWTDKRNGINSTLTTLNDDEKGLISVLNEYIVADHQIKSGSKVNVEKFHKEARNQEFQKLKDGYSKS